MWFFKDTKSPKNQQKTTKENVFFDSLLLRHIAIKSHISGLFYFETTNETTLSEKTYKKDNYIKLSKMSTISS
jgi:hypothetical protein